MPSLVSFPRALLLLAFLLVVLADAPRPVSADEGWVINSFDVHITVQPDGSLQVQERLSVDFRRLQKHGIFRDIPIVYRYEEQLPHSP